MQPRSMANNFPKLRDAGVMTSTAKTVVVTELGMKMADTSGLVSSAPQSHEEHQQRLMNKYKLTPSEKKVLMELADGKEVNKQDLADKLQMKIRSFSNLLTNPKKHDLLEIDKSTIRLTDKMFLKKPGRPSGK
jgi:DNA-binding CsgD family transcriptional regulator